MICAARASCSRSDSVVGRSARSASCLAALSSCSTLPSPCTAPSPPSPDSSRIFAQSSILFCCSVLCIAQVEAGRTMNTGRQF